MPELPDVVVYVEAIARHIGGHVVQRVRVKSPFLVRTFDPRVSAVEGLRVDGVRRLGKRIVIVLEGGILVVIHPMIAGRFQWKVRDATTGEAAKIGGKNNLAAFDFEHGTLLLTEASSKQRASLHVLRGEDGLAALDRGGIEPLDAERDAFVAALTRGNHTLKRALTDPRYLSGIGNAYSDEILHRARLSPVKLTSRVTDEEWTRLFEATRTILAEWTDRLRKEVGDGFPKKVTAFRKEMAVHGKYGEPCPECGTLVQRIVRAAAGNEVNYCPRCQTGGKLLADRALSRLLNKDWPKTIEELEDQQPESGGVGGA